MFFHVITLLFYKLIREQLKSLLWENDFFLVLFEKDGEKKNKSVSHFFF